MNNKERKRLKKSGWNDATRHKPSKKDDTVLLYCRMRDSRNSGSKYYVFKIGFYWRKLKIWMLGSGEGIGGIGNSVSKVLLWKKLPAIPEIRHDWKSI